jgi:hypothetical protein
MDTFTPEKSKFLDSMNRPITQGLFLEIGYTENSYYTLKDHDHNYNDRIYPSLKRLYLEEADPTEYAFACKYLLGWRHWLRLLENKQIRKHIDEWREELEVKLRAQGVANIIAAAQQGSYQAGKWMADRGWEVHGVGRPKKADITAQKRFEQHVVDEYGADVHRLFAGDKVG